MFHTSPATANFRHFDTNQARLLIRRDCSASVQCVLARCWAMLHADHRPCGRWPLTTGEDPHRRGPGDQLSPAWSFTQQRCQLSDVRFVDPALRCEQRRSAQVPSVRCSRTSPRPSMAICQAGSETRRSAARSRSPSTQPTE